MRRDGLGVYHPGPREINMRALARQLGLGRALYLAFHAPVAAMHRIRREGGFSEYLRNSSGRRQMMNQASRMPQLPAAASLAEPVSLAFVTGRRFWYQTVFCAWTFAWQAKCPVRATIFDDGSLTKKQFDAIARVCGGAVLVSEAETTDRLDQLLPTRTFPFLRARRETLPLMRKLLDVHVGHQGWRLALDSDLLFFRPPHLVLKWLAEPLQPLHAEDVQNAYGYPLVLLAEIAGCPVPERINTGILGLRSDAIDWEKMEFWCRKLIELQGPHYYQEQALVALLLAGHEHSCAPIEDYVTLPRPPEAHECRAVMHHYVADSKRWYFQENWRRAMSLAV